MNKKELRIKYLDIRKKIKNKDIKSNKIFEKIIKDNDYLNSNVIAIYNNLDDEVRTNKLIEYSLKNGKKVCLPIVEGNTMRFYLINEDTKYQKSKYGIDEPISNTVVINIDLFIIPGVVFGKDLNRIGFGGGFYDRYLDDKSIKIGICFEEQIISMIESDVNDVRMDKIITDKNIYYDKIK